MDDLRLDAVVDAVADQPGQRQAGHRVEAVKHQPDDQRDRQRPEQLAQRELLVRGPRGLAELDVRLVPDRRQRVHLRQQLSRRRQAGQHAGDVPSGGAGAGTAAAACGDPLAATARNLVQTVLQRHLIVAADPR